MTVIHLIRHGQASWGKRDYDRLSDTGRRQAVVVGEELAERGIEATTLISGAMRRQRDTAALMAGAAGWGVPASEDPGWNEYDHMGVLAGYKRRYRSMTVMKADLVRTGKPYAAFEAMYAQAIGAWVGGQAPGRYAEPFADFSARVDDALDRLIDSAGHDDTVVVATSAGVIARVITRVVDGPSATWVRLERAITNGSLSTLRVGARGLHLVTFNESRHLESQPGLATVT